MNQITRREVLELCALSLLATQIGCTPNVQLDVTSTQTIADLGSNLTHLESCKVIGRAWLDTQTRPFDARQTYESLFASVEEGTTLKTQQAALRRRQAQDFKVGRIINRGGWLMSETELKVYALLATI